MSTDALYPGLSAPMSAAVEAVMSGRRPDPNKYHVYYHQIWHRLGIVTGGTFTSNLTFFTQTTAPGVTNFFGSAGLPQDQAAVAVGASTKFQIGTVYATGSPSAVPINHSQIVPAAVSATVPAGTVAQAQQAELMSWLHQNGQITLTIGNRDVVDNIHGADSLPYPGGMMADWFQQFSATHAAGNGTSTGFANYNNGIPQAGNFFPFSPRQIILPGKPVTGRVVYQGTQPTSTGLDVVLKFVIHCIMIRPANA